MDKNKAVRIIERIFFIFMLAATVLAVVFMTLLFRKDERNSDINRFDRGWTDKNGKTADLRDIENYSAVYNKIPDIKKDSVIYIDLKGINITVSVGGKNVYTTRKELTPFLGITPGKYHARVDVSPGDSGKEICIRPDTENADRSARINSIVEGSPWEVLDKYITDIISGFFFSVFYICVGIIFLLLFIPVRRIGNDTLPILYLGVFSFNVGIFVMCDCGMLQILYGHEALFHTISEMAMMFIALPMLFYIETQYKGIGEKGLIFYGICTLLVFLVSMILDMTGTADLHHTVFLTHITYLIAIIFLIRSAVFAIKEHKWIHVAGMTGIIAGVVTDIMLLLFSKFRETSLFTRIGVMVFLSLEGSQFIMYMVSWQKDMTRQEFVHKLAYMDGLTSLPNRTSFQEDMEKLKEAEKLPAAVVFFDVNNLKYINDTYGHAEGDELLTTFSKCLQQVYGVYGKCYRIGGDEFVFMTEEKISHSKMQSLSDVLDALLKSASLSGIPDFDITAAAGIVFSDEEYKDADDMVNAADAAMYENKRAFKKLKAEIR